MLQPPREPRLRVIDEQTSLARIVETRSSESLFKSEITLLLSSGGGGGWFAYRTLTFFINRGEGVVSLRFGSVLILWRDFYLTSSSFFCNC